jgi:hypothetical protein
VKRWGPGTVWELPSGASVQVVGNTFNGQFLVGLIPKVEELADATSRISRLGTSANLPSGTTATAAAGFLQAQDEGKDQYSTFIAPIIAEVFAFLREVLDVHWQAISKRYGSKLGVESHDDIDVPVRFLPTGKSSSTNPSTLLQKLQMALGLAQNPETVLDYQSVEKQVLQALDLPFSVSGLEKKGPSADEWRAILAGLLSGQVSPQEAAQILQEAKGGSSGQARDMGVPPGGQPPVPPAGAVPAGPAPSAPGPLPGPALG